MAILNDLVVTGQSRLLNKLYASSGIEVTGSETINKGGLLVSNYYNENGLSGQIVLKSNTGNACIMRVDSTNMYFLLSSSNTDYTYNSLRPFYINTSTGQITMNKVNLSGALYVNSTATIVGSTTFHNGITVNGTTATTSLTASTGLFTNCQVLDTLRTTTWSLDNVASLGGHFYVSPTLFFSSSTTATISAISGTTVTMAIKDSNSIKSNSAGGVTWPSGAKVKLSGRLGNVVLGTCTGTLTSAMNATAGTITLTFTFANASSLSVKTYAASEIYNLTIMMYNNGTYPVGIAMTSYGTNGYSYIDIYSGSTAATNPNVRIGKLDGLPAITLGQNSFSPEGYGLYTTNGFFNGKIVSTAGVIGGFLITTEYLRSNPDKVGISATNTNWAFYAGYNSSTGQAPFRVNNAGALYCTDLHATGGYIGKYTITESYLMTGSGTSCTGMGGNQAFWAGADASNSAPFRVSYAGALVATNATITGSITATSGSIAGSLVTSGINASNITTGTLKAQHIAIGDFTNYSKLNDVTYDSLGFTKVADSSASNNPWYQLKTLTRDILLSPSGNNTNGYYSYPCNGGETFRIEFQVSSTVQGTSGTDASGAKGYLYINVGLYNVSNTGTYQWTIPTGGLSDASGTVRTVSVTATLPTNARTFGVFLQLGGYNFTGTCKIRNVKVTKMSSSELIVDGAITASKISSGSITTDKLAANCVTVGKMSVENLSSISANLGTITAGSINIGSGKFTVSSAGAMSCTGATINGAVTATSMTANTYYAIYTGSTSTRFIYYDAPEIRIGLPATSTGDLSDLLAGFSFHSSGQTQCWGSLTVSNTLTAPYLKATIDVTAPTVNAATVIGNTWYSSTYGGGWYMSDTTWIRSYGSKNIYQNSGILRTDGTLQVGANGAYFKASSAGITAGVDFVTTGTIHINNTSAASDMTNDTVGLCIGTKGGNHLEIDSNTIQSKSSATAGRSLHINPDSNYTVSLHYNQTGSLRFQNPDSTSRILCNSNVTIQSTKASSTLPGSITLRSAGYWTSSSDYNNGTIQLQDKNSNTWIHLAFDSTGPYFASKAIYNRTTSSGSAVYVSSSGVLMRYSSASKYKTDIQPIEDKTYAYNVLKLTPKSWYDKTEIESYTRALERKIEGEDPNDVYANYKHTSIERINGLVAEDVEAAGLEKYCVYEVDTENNTKEIEGINYEKVTTLLIPVVRDLVLYTQKTAKYIHVDEMTDNDRDEIAELLTRINSFKENEVIM